MASAVAACPVVTLEAQVSRCAQRVFRQARNECADGHLRTISRADAMSFDAWHAPGLVNERSEHVPCGRESTALTLDKT